MMHTGSMGKIGRRCYFNFIILPYFHYNYFYPAHLFIHFQVSAAVRNRSAEMAESLYNMNRVHKYQPCLLFQHF